MKKYVISSCLLGVKCRYNGESYIKEDLLELFNNNRAMPICPEVLGGLETPRKSAEIIQKNSDEKLVIDCDGKDLTESFKLGAKSALAIANIFGANSAILKSCSPSCGTRQVYDGSFSCKKIEGEGITAELFRKKGIKVFNEDNWNK